MKGLNVASFCILLNLAIGAFSLSSYGSIQTAMEWSDSQYNGSTDTTPFTLGYRFRVNADLVVTELGSYDADGNGLFCNHLVAIWPAGGGEPLAVTTMPPGTEAPLVGHFRYKTASSVLLTQDTEYIIGASAYGSAGTDPAAQAVSGFYTSPDITWLGPRQVWTPSGGLSFPSSEGGPYGIAFFGPNFRYLLMSPAPFIVAQPTNRATTMGETAIFSVAAHGSTPLYYQWRHNGQNLLGATNTSLTIGNARDVDVGKYSVLVTNAYGTTESSVAYLAIVAGAVFQRELFLPDYQEVPQKEPQQDSLVIVTHGWQKKYLWQSGPDPNFFPWVTELSDAIRERLANQGKTNWRVQPYFWIADSWTEIADYARGNAERHGDALGARIGTQHWAHVHLIAHSAGSALIQAAAEKIKQVSSTTIVHTTFLDPFVGFTTSGRLEYGRLSNWADHYFAEDMTGYTTSRRLKYAYNVNVTRLDPHRTETPYYCSGASEPSVNRAALSSHAWPHEFFTLTVPPYFMPDSGGFGFPLSKEGDGWDDHDGSDQRVSYPADNSPIELGESFPCLQFVNPIPTSTAPSFDLSQLQSAISTIGATVFADRLELNSFLPSPQPQRQLAGASLQTNSTSWISLAIPVSNAVNYLSFSAGFSSASGSEGLLTVYWNTNSIGTIDERTAVAGTQTYRFPLPATYTEGLYTANFRLDSFNDITSRLSVADVALGLAGDPEPFSLGFVATNTTGGAVLTLKGAPGYNYLITSSTNCVDWSPFALLANTNGSVRFFDPSISNYQQRFYRANRQ